MPIVPVYVFGQSVLWSQVPLPRLMDAGQKRGGLDMLGLAGISCGLGLVVQMDVPRRCFMPVCSGYV